MTAQLADKAYKLLQAKITEYRIGKAQQNLTFIQDRYNERKKEFEAAQDRLARFRDRNLNMASNMAKTEEERLQSEYPVTKPSDTEWDLVIAEAVTFHRQVNKL